MGAGGPKGPQGPEGLEAGLRLGPDTWVLPPRTRPLALASPFARWSGFCTPGTVREKAKTSLTPWSVGVRGRRAGDCVYRHEGKSLDGVGRRHRGAPREAQMAREKTERASLQRGHLVWALLHE